MLMLCTNLIKKDLSSNLADGAMALHTLCQIANRDLARDLHHDVSCYPDAVLSAILGQYLCTLDQSPFTCRQFSPRS